ncbi:MAG: hypothetical protein M1828_004999 [Chrysothrix sp. TS-e1954]|nr:MAG: hypothetical protein M1828_004999 [Chrysothrix sp. TS-e1954]
MDRNVEQEQHKISEFKARSKPRDDAPQSAKIASSTRYDRSATSTPAHSQQQEPTGQTPSSTKREPTDADLLNTAYELFGEKRWKELPQHRRDHYYNTGYLHREWRWDNETLEEKRARSFRDTGDPLLYERPVGCHDWPEWLDPD